MRELEKEPPSPSRLKGFRATSSLRRGAPLSLLACYSACLLFLHQESSASTLPCHKDGVARETVVFSMVALLPQSAWPARLLCLALLWAQALHAADYSVFCNGDVYGNPVSTQCIGALARLPIHDTAVHYFVEQQLRTAPPQAVWNEFNDPRPPSEKQTVVQLPRRISYGQPDLYTWHSV